MPHSCNIPLYKYLYIEMSKKSITENYNGLAETLKSVAHPERIAILNLICNCREKRMTVKSIYESLELEQPIVSRHLGILKRCGMLERENEGVSTFYAQCRNNKMAERIYKCLCNYTTLK